MAWELGTVHSNVRYDGVDDQGRAGKTTRNATEVAANRCGDVGECLIQAKSGCNQCHAGNPSGRVAEARARSS